MKVFLGGSDGPSYIYAYSLGSFKLTFGGVRGQVCVHDSQIMSNQSCKNNHNNNIH